MNIQNVYFTGFAMVVEFQLKVNDIALTESELDAVGAITAGLVSLDRTGLATGSTKVTCTRPGGSVIRATWSAAQTTDIPAGRYLVEPRTADGPFCYEGIAVSLLAGISP